VNNRAVVHINGAKVGAAERATVSDSQGNRRGFLVDAEIILVEPGSDLEGVLEREASAGKNNFDILVEFADGRRLGGQNAHVTLVSTGRSTIVAGRGRWEPS